MSLNIIDKRLNPSVHSICMAIDAIAKEVDDDITCEMTTDETDHLSVIRLFNGNGIQLFPSEEMITSIIKEIFGIPIYGTASNPLYEIDANEGTVYINAPGYYSKFQKVYDQMIEWGFKIISATFGVEEFTIEFNGKIFQYCDQLDRLQSFIDSSVENHDSIRVTGWNNRNSTISINLNR